LQTKYSRGHRGERAKRCWRTLADGFLHQVDEGLRAPAGRSGVASATRTVEDRVDPRVIEPEVLRVTAVGAVGTLGRDDDVVQSVQVDPRLDPVGGQDDDPLGTTDYDDQVDPTIVEEGAGDTGVVGVDQHTALIPTTGLEDELRRVLVVEDVDRLVLGHLVGGLALGEHLAPPTSLAEDLTVGGAGDHQVTDVACHTPGGLVVAQMLDERLDVGMPTVHGDLQLLADAVDVGVDHAEDPRDDGHGGIPLLVHLPKEPYERVGQTLKSTRLVVLVADRNERDQAVTANLQGLGDDLRRGTLTGHLVLVRTDVDDEHAVPLPLVDLGLFRLELAREHEVEVFELRDREPAVQVQGDDLVEHRTSGDDDASKPLHGFLLRPEVGAHVSRESRRSCFQGADLLVGARDHLQ